MDRETRILWDVVTNTKRRLKLSDVGAWRSPEAEEEGSDECICLACVTKADIKARKLRPMEVDALESWFMSNFTCEKCKHRIRVQM
jgi:hypothetical protein